MNKEEFQTKKNDIDSKIRELKNQKIQLEKEYIERQQHLFHVPHLCRSTLHRYHNRTQSL